MDKDKLTLSMLLSLLLLSGCGLMTEQAKFRSQALVKYPQCRMEYATSEERSNAMFFGEYKKEELDCIAYYDSPKGQRDLANRKQQEKEKWEAARTICRDHAKAEADKMGVELQSIALYTITENNILDCIVYVRDQYGTVAFKLPVQL